MSQLQTVESFVNEAIHTPIRPEHETQTAAATQRFVFEFPETGGVVVSDQEQSKKDHLSLGGLESAIIRSVVDAQTMVHYRDLLRVEQLDGKPSKAAVTALNSALVTIRETFADYDLPWSDTTEIERRRPVRSVGFLGGVVVSAEHVEQHEVREEFDVQTMAARLADADYVRGLISDITLTTREVSQFGLILARNGKPFVSSDIYAHLSGNELTSKQSYYSLLTKLRASSVGDRLGVVEGTWPRKFVFGEAWYDSQHESSVQRELESRISAIEQTARKTRTTIPVDMPEGTTIIQGELRERYTSPDDLAQLLIEDDEESWLDRALCAQTDPEAFFPEKGGSTREARRVCQSCDVREDCLQTALKNDERFGIWGGLTERERRALKRRR